MTSSPSLVYSLGDDLGSLLYVGQQPSTCDEVSAGAAAGVVACPKPDPLVVLVMDISASMGNTAGRALRSLNHAMQRTFPEVDPIVIMFGSHVVSAKLSEVLAPSFNFRLHGSTHMNGVAAQVRQVLLDPKTSDRAAVLLVASDGAVEDSAMAASQAAASLVAVRSRPGPVSVGLVRCLTSSYAQPDTSALACYGAYNTGGGAVPVVDVLSAAGGSISPELEEECLAAAFAEALEKQHVTVCVAAPTAALHRLPTDTPVSTLHVVPGTYLLIAPGVAADTLLVNGELLPTAAYANANTWTEATLVPFLQYVETQLRHALVSNNTSQCAAVSSWLQKLQTRLQAQVAAAATTLTTEAGVPTAAVTTSTAARVRQVLRRVSAAQKSVLMRVLQLANTDRVAALNSAQKADFLRGGMTSARTAKRVAKTAGFDFDEQVREGLRQLLLRLEAGRAAAKAGAGSGSGSGSGSSNSAQGQQPSPNEDDPDAVSFYSMDTWGNVMAEARELMANLDDLEVADVMPIVGGLGVPFHAPRGDFPDPWSFYVTDVHIGLYVNEADLCAVESIGADSRLRFPGVTDAERSVITGVVPLRRLSPLLGHAYARTQLAALHASFALRGALAPVPHDALAMAAAVLMRLVQHIGVERQPTAAELNVLTALTDQVARDAAHVLAEFGNQLRTAANQDPRACCIGDNNMPLKVLAASLGLGALTPARALAAFEVATYQAAKRAFRGVSAADTREHAVRQLLKLDLAAFEERTRDVDPAVADAAALPYTFEVDMDVATVPHWMPRLTEFAAAVRLLRPGVTTFPATTVKDALGVENVDLANLAAAVFAARCTHESDRVDKAACNALGPHFQFASECKVYLLNVAGGIYADNYLKRAKERRQQLADEAKLRAVQALAAAPTLAVFITQLPEVVPSRNDNAYEWLLREVFAGTPETVPLAPEKALVLVTGRLPTADGSAIWAAGNVDSRARTFRDQLRALGVWDQVEELLSRRVVHTYRDKPNRHGHSNEKPSYFGLGYATLGEMQANVPHEDWVQYCAAHRGCCGLPA